MPKRNNLPRLGVGGVGKSGGKGFFPARLSLQRLVQLMLLGAILASCTSVVLFLGILDSAVGKEGATPSLSIRAIHALQQAKARALRASSFEKLQKPAVSCFNESTALTVTKQFLLPLDRHDLHTAEPSRHREVKPRGPSARRSASEEAGLERGEGPGTRRGSWVSGLKGALTGAFGKATDMSGMDAVLETWRDGKLMCRRWVATLSEQEPTTNGSSSVAGLQVTLGTEVLQEARREGWDANSSLAWGYLEVGAATLALSFWDLPPKQKPPLKARSKRDGPHLAQSFPLGLEGARQLGRVETLPRGPRQQLELGSLLSLVPAGARSLSIDMCSADALPFLQGNRTWGLGAILSFYSFNPTNASCDDSSPIAPASCLGHNITCELRQQPFIRYMESQASLGRQNFSVISEPFQLAISWESNCNVVRHQVTICRGEGGGACQLLPGAEVINGTGPGGEEPFFPDGSIMRLSSVKSVQVASARWMHSVTVPVLPGGRFRYAVHSGDVVSRTFVFWSPPPWPPVGGIEGPAQLSLLQRKRKEEFHVAEKRRIGRKGYHVGSESLKLPHAAQSGQPVLHVAILSDSQNNPSVFRRHLLHLQKHKPRAGMLVHVGDRVQMGASLLEWAQLWIAPLVETGVAQSIPSLGVYGNHDADEQLLARSFAPLASTRGWFALTVGNCLWIGLDSNLGPQDYPEQGKWLEATLLNLQTARVEGSAPSFVIVLVHIPPFIDYWEPKTWRAGEKHWGEFVRVSWVPLFEKFGVDLVISGHSHVYQRGERNGVTYVIVGGGGGALDKKRVEDWGMYKVAHFGHHYAWLDLTATVLSWTAFDLANKPFDHVKFVPDGHH